MWRLLGRGSRAIDQRGHPDGVAEEDLAEANRLEADRVVGHRRRRVRPRLFRRRRGKNELDDSQRRRSELLSRRPLLA